MLAADGVIAPRLARQRDRLLGRAAPAVALIKVVEASGNLRGRREDAAPRIKDALAQRRVQVAFRMLFEQSPDRTGAAKCRRALSHGRLQQKRQQGAASDVARDIIGGVVATELLAMQKTL